MNNYSYDALHRITAMHNTLQRPGLPAEDAYSTSYSYDRAGNIQRLSRRGFVGMSGNAPVYDLIDDLHYSYAPGANPVLNAFSSKLQGVDDVVTDAAAQPHGVVLPSSGYGYDDNHACLRGVRQHMISAGSVSAEYNIFNLPTVLSTSNGDRKFEYVFGGGKYSAELITGNQAIDEMRHYLGGMEFKNGILEAYNFGDGRVVWENSVPKFQYRLADHLGNTVVFFEDKNNNGCITTEEEATSPADLEIIQRLLYYPFGMALEGLGAWNAQPWQQYRYNGKERDTLTGWYDYGARWAIMEIGGRFVSIDPLTEKMPGWSPYSYGFDNPVQYTDPTGMEPEGSFGVNDKIDIDKKTGKVTITAAAGDDVVRIMNGGKVESSYTYGKNASFKAENKIENRTFGKKAIPGQVIVSSNATKALDFFKFAAKSNVEFGLLKVKKGESVLSVLSTTHEPTKLNSSGFLITEYFKKGYSGIDHWHSHPDGNPVPSGYYPEKENNPYSLMPGSVGTKDDFGDAKHARLTRQLEGFQRTQFFLYTPALKTITRYDGYTKATIQKDN